LGQDGAAGTHHGRWPIVLEKATTKNSTHRRVVKGALILLEGVFLLSRRVDSTNLSTYRDWADYRGHIRPTTMTNAGARTTPRTGSWLVRFP
jgi:hypothetical protein